METIDAPGSAVPHSEWLSECEGFRVRYGKRSAGVIDEIIRSHDGRPVSLSVRRGIFVLHRNLVPIADVLEIVPAKATIVLRSVARKREHTRRGHPLRHHALRRVG